MARDRARPTDPTNAALLAGRYAYDGEVGRGSSGRAIALVDRGSERRVGKILDAAAGARAMWELDALSSIESPHVVRAIELLWVLEPLPAPFAIPRGSWVLVQSRAEGELSSEVLAAIDDPERRGARLRELALGVARGLHALHAAGLSHGDVKPDNVVAEGAHATLIDLGAAAPFGRAEALSGTLAFMSAEAREGERSPATDLYALGATLIVWATGRPPAPEEPLDLPGWVPQAVAHTARALLSDDASERPHDAARVLELLGAAPAPRGLRDRVPAVGLEIAIERLIEVLETHGAARVVGPPGSGRSRWIEETARAIQRRAARAGAEPPTYVRAHRHTPSLDVAAIVHLDGERASAADAVRILAEGRIAGVTHRVVIESVSEATDDAIPVLRVSPLDEAETRTLLATLTGEAPSQATARAAIEATAGHAGRLVRGAHALLRLELDPLRASDWPVVTRAVEERSLSPQAREVAALASVLGGSITLDPSAELGLPRELTAGARELAREGLAELREDGSLTLRGDAQEPFSRAARVRALERAATLPLTGLARWVLDAQSLGHESADRSVASHAREIRDRGEPEAAAQLLDRYLAAVPPRESAAREALVAMAAEAHGASGELGRALDAVARLEHPTPQTRRLHAELLRLVGRVADALSLASEDTEPSPERVALLARAELTRDPEAAAVHARTILSSASVSARARAREVLALVALRDARLAEALDHAREGRHAAEHIEGLAARRGAEARLASVEAVALSQAGHLDEARARHEESARLASLGGDRLLEATFRVNEGLAALEHGSLGAALAALETGARLFLRLERPRELARSLANLANAWGLAGDDARARGLLDEAARALALVADPEASALAAIVEGEVLLRRGKLRAAIGALEAARSGPSSMAAILDARLATARATVGEREAAERLLASIDVTLDPLSATEVALARARIALHAGRVDDAAEVMLVASRHAASSAVGFDPRVRTLAIEIEIEESRGRRSEARVLLGRLRTLIEPTLRGLAPPQQARFRQIPIVRRALAEGAFAASPTSRAAELALDALAVLARETRLEVLDERLATLALEVSAAERAFVVEWSATGPVVRARAGAARADPSSRPSASIVARALRETVLVSSDAIHERDASSSVHALALRSVVALEILPRRGPRRVLVVDDPLRAAAFDPSVVSALRALVEVAGPLLAARVESRRARMRERRAEQHSATVEADLVRLRAETSEGEATDPFASFVHADPVTARLIDETRRLAASELPLLVVGESGVGKDLLARAIHRASARRHEPFVAERAGTLSGPLADAALFGHTRGAFTGADGARKGLFELANGGTLFLDGVEDLPLEAQAKLLRILVEGEVRPLGASRARRVEVRLIAATRLAPEDAIAAGLLREDFYYRVAGAVLRVPPLRDRPTDLDLLVDRLLARSGRAVRLSSRARDALRARRWPGNVRELEHTLTEALLRVDGDVLDVAALAGDTLSAPPGEPSSLHALRGALTRELVLETLERHHGNRTHTARALGLSRFGLQKILRRILPQPEDASRRAK